MKVVFLQDDFPPYSKGGAGNAAATLARALHARGVAISVITTVEDKANAGKGEWEGVPVYRIYSNYHERWRGWKSLNNRRVVKEVKKILEELKPDIVHAHNVHQHLSYACLPLAKALGARVFVTAHDAMLVAYGKVTGEHAPSAWHEWRTQKLRYNPLRNFYIKRTLTSVEKVFAVSNALARLLSEAGIKRVETLYNGIDLAVHTTAEEVEKIQSDYELAGKKVLLFGGRISQPKGAEALLATMPLIVTAVPSAVLFIAGKESAYTKKLAAFAAELGVASHIRFSGWLGYTALEGAYEAAQVVVQPSLYFEPFGLVALEGMKHGKPVVVGNKGGLPEVVTDGVTGFVVDPSDATEFSKKIVALLQDERMAAQMGQAGRKRAEDVFSIERQVVELLKWYQS